MNTNAHQRCHLFIDGSTLHYAAKDLGITLDYAAFLKYFASSFRLVRARYYAVLSDGDEHTPVKPLVDWLSYNGFVVSRKIGRKVIGQDGRERLSGSTDVDIAVDLLEAAPVMDHAVLVVADASLRPAIASVQRSGCRVSLVGTVRTAKSSTADALRRQADEFLELGDLADVIGRAEKKPELPAFLQKA